MAVAVELNHVSKSYGSLKALDEVSFAIQAGTIFGLLGPNGAGKSTTMRICSTLLKPDGGEVYFEGIPCGKVAATIGCSLSLMPQGNALDAMLNVEDNLHYYCRLKKMNRHERNESVERAVEAFGLSEFRKRSVLSISGGQFRRTQLARAFLGAPRVVLLDEPTLGIDIQGKLSIWETIKKFASETGGTVFVASNDITEIETICDEVAFIDHGELLYIGDAHRLEVEDHIHLRCRLSRPYSSDRCTIPGSIMLSSSSDLEVELLFSEYGHEVTGVIEQLASEFGLVSLTEHRATLTDLFRRFGAPKS